MSIPVQRISHPSGTRVASPAQKPIEFIPHAYQQFAIDFILSHPVSAVLLDMGLGKSVICLTAIEQLIYDRFEVNHVLVVAPLRVATMTWPNELRKWVHLSSLTFSVATGTPSERRAAILERSDITIINRENLSWLVSSGLSLDYDMLVIDELSSFKNHQSQRFKAFMKLRPHAARVVGLTGTPSSNGLMDLFAEYRCLDMGQRLGRFIGQYRELYFTPDRRNGNIIYSYRPRPGAQEQIYNRIRDITVSMRAMDHLPMPELIFNTCPVRFSASEREQYNTLRADLLVPLQTDESGRHMITAASSSQVPHPFASATGVPKAQSLHCSSSSRQTRSAGLCRDNTSVVTAANAAALSNKLCQLANGCVYSDDGKAVAFHSRKLDILEDLLESATSPVLVAYWYRHDLARIRERLSSLGISFAELTTPAAIREWNAGNLQVGLIHPASAGHGLNLQQGGHHLIWYSLSWSLELYEQVNARLWRQGQQSRTVIITHIIAEGTIDEHILSALAAKSSTQNALIYAVRAVLPS